MINPFREGLRINKKLEPAIFILFGGSGDLAKRKIIPSLFKLAEKKILPENTKILTIASSERNDGEYRALMKDAMLKFTKNFDENAWKQFENRMFYISGKFDRDDTYIKLKSTISELCKNTKIKNSLIFYLATQPSYYQSIINGIAKIELNDFSTDGTGIPKIVIEKPFGRDNNSAQQLNEVLNLSFNENQIFRIDHYLGKDTVQNIFAFRFANTIFEPIWNSKYIDHIQLTSSESIGIEDRGRYYEESGAMRDMMQNHILQILSLISMEQPASMSAESISNEKLKVLKSIRTFTPKSIESNIVRGQYGRGRITGIETRGYREESGVSEYSSTETYIAAKFEIDNERWKGTPFYIRTGKRLHKRKTEIYIQFKSSESNLFNQYHPAYNSIVMRIQPNEGISIMINSKLPETDMRLQTVDMDFNYLTDMGAIPQESYEKLLADCMQGDQTLFTDKSIQTAQWNIIDPIIDYWKSTEKPDFPNYQGGTAGPKAALYLMIRDGRKWRRI